MWNLTTLSWSTSSRRYCVSTKEAACPWSMKCTSHGTGECTPSKDCTDTVEWDAIIAAVKWMTFRRSRYVSKEPWVSRPEVLEVFRDVNWIHTTVCGTHICCQWTVLFIYVACNCRTPVVWSLNFRHRASSILGQAFHYLIFAWLTEMDISWGIEVAGA